MGLGFMHVLVGILGVFEEFVSGDGRARCRAGTCYAGWGGGVKVI
jgi:hypothetical protein